MTITSWAAARALQDPEHLRLLKLFLGPQGNTVAAAARTAGLELHTVYRRVRRLAEVGLLSALHQRPRPGKAVQVYGCLARRYYIPNHLISLDEYLWSGFGPFVSKIKSHLALAYTSGPNPVTGVLVGDLPHDFLFTLADAERRPWPAHGTDTPTTISIYQTLHMSHEQAQHFNLELQALVDRYRDASPTGTYLLGLFMLPDRV